MKNIKTKIKIIVGAGLLSCLIPHLICAENWKQESISGIGSIIAYKNNLFAFFTTPPSLGEDGKPAWIYRSPNGVDWEPVTLPDTGTFFYPMVYFRIHKDALYLFANAGSLQPQPDVILRTTDGLAFDVVREDESTPSRTLTYPNAFSAQDGHLYVVLNSGQVIRTTGDGPSPTWDTTTVAPIPEWIMGRNISKVSMAEQNGVLYVAINQMDFINGIYRHYSIRIYKKTVGQQWERVGSLSSERTRHAAYIKLISNGEKLLLACGAYLWEIDTQKNPCGWIQRGIPSPGSHPIAYMFQDNAYFWVLNSKVLKLNQDGFWEYASQIVSPSSIGSPEYAHLNGNPAILNNKAFIVAHGKGLWTFQLGVEDVTARDIPGEDLFQGQRKAPILGFDIVLNKHEAIQLTVKNRGTATANRDIDKVSLGRMSLDIKGFTIEPIKDLLPNSDNKSWSLPSYVPVEDGDQLFLTVDISPTAKPGQTLHFFIDSDSDDRMKFETHTEFRMPYAIRNLQLKEIKSGPAGAGAPSPIADTVVFPQPARNQVQFAYDLASPSNVTISIYNQQGLRLSEIKDYHAAAGASLKSAWDATHVPSGTYYAHIKIEGSDGSMRQFTKSVFINK
jgi:hypothetical protein